jgi:hypothetical protein
MQNMLDLTMNTRYPFLFAKKRDLQENKQFEKKEEGGWV